MHYLVTGGAGFIGWHLCQALRAAGHTLTVLDDFSTGSRAHVLPGTTLVEGDVADAPTVQRALQGAAGCFHLAAIASVERCENEPQRGHAVNFGGTEHVLRAAEAAGVPVVYASSSAIYGDQPTLPLHEGMNGAPVGAYGRDKLACERAASTSPARSMGLRFFNVYGPGQDPRSPYSGVITLFMQRALSGEPLTINGDGEQTRDFIHVRDVVLALMLSMRALEEGRIIREVCNVATGVQTSVNALAFLLKTLAESDSAVQHGPSRVGDARHSVGCVKRARELLGFEAKTPMKEGISALITWFRGQICAT